MIRLKVLDKKLEDRIRNRSKDL